RSHRQPTSSPEADTTARPSRCTPSEELLDLDPVTDDPLQQIPLALGHRQLTEQRPLTRLPGTHPDLDVPARRSHLELERLLHQSSSRSRSRAASRIRNLTSCSSVKPSSTASMNPAITPPILPSLPNGTQWERTRPVVAGGTADSLPPHWPPPPIRGGCGPAWSPVARQSTPSTGAAPARHPSRRTPHLGQPPIAERARTRRSATTRRRSTPS